MRKIPLGSVGKVPMWRFSAIVGMGVTPLVVFFVTPLLHPFRWSRLLWTYVVPLVPLVVLVDGIVSCLRTYTPDELRELTMGIPGMEAYLWDIGEEAVAWSPTPVTYLIGYPASTSASPNPPAQQTAGADAAPPR